ncbi:MAG TPA: hypothetical protein VG602_03575 [Actinomycetota bacterium]|nr:hypothetical protein [Actinomycetota bacterium]
MAVFLVAVAVGTTAVLVVLLVALLGHVKRLATSVSEMQEAMSPLLEEIRDGSERARTKLENLEERRAQLRRPLG